MGHEGGLLHPAERGSLGETSSGEDVFQVFRSEKPSSPTDELLVPALRETAPSGGVQVPELVLQLL